MAEQNGKQATKGITGITISGFKSLRDESHIDVRPLTILAGANSSGKSSIMQPLLLMKQTLEAGYDPGPLLLNGPNVKFTNVEQFLSISTSDSNFKRLKIGLDLDDATTFFNIFEKDTQDQKHQIRLIETSSLNSREQRAVTLTPDMKHEDITKTLPEILRKFQIEWQRQYENELHWRVIRSRCFLGVDLVRPNSDVSFMSGKVFTTGIDEEQFLNLIHLPGLRPNPERTYRYTSVDYESYPGTFENYAASVIYQWLSSDDMRFGDLVMNLGLTRLGLTSGVGVRQIDDSQLELQVNRLIKGTTNRTNDMISIADVGFGVSQVLPVLVALLVAEPGQLVYIEQPELHLHPRAQVALAQVLADAANRGVKVVAETHSTLLIQGIQTLIAEQKIDHKDVIFHWFKRGEDGVTQITSQEPDAFGAYGDWPEDFADVQFEADNTYLEAVEKRRAEELHDGQEPEMSGD